MPDPGVPIGTLRWVVILARRAQAPDPNGPGLCETLQPIAAIHADIQPVGALTFWTAAAGGEQVDTPVTHRITVRSLDNLDQSMAILRRSQRPDGTVRTETFRIRRIKDVGGRKRFTEIEAELERTT